MKDAKGEREGQQSQQAASQPPGDDYQRTS
jgi:hypothetical protein